MAAVVQEVLIYEPTAGGTRPWKPQDLFKLKPSEHPPAEKGTQADIESDDFLEEYIMRALDKVSEINDTL